jgi:hypothetical protein
MGGGPGEALEQERSAWLRCPTAENTPSARFWVNKGSKKGRAAR